MKLKHLLLTFLVIFCIFAVNAIDTTKIAQRWKITKFVKKTHVIPHKEDDFMQFDASHSYEQVLEGLYTKGNWTFKSATNTLTTNSGGVIHEWTVTELTARKLI